MNIINQIFNLFKLKISLIISLVLVIGVLLAPTCLAQYPNLGTATSYALFTSVGAITNTGASVLTGDVGTNAGAFTGFPPGTVKGQIHIADPVSATATTDVANAYSYLSAMTCGVVIGVGLGNNQILTPNIYCTGAATTLNGNLILDAQGDPGALFIFKINGAFSTGSSANILLVNGASLCNVYWQINGQFDLGASSVFRGIIIANGAINLLSGSTLLGKGLSKAGAITLQNNVVTISTEPIIDSIIGTTNICVGKTTSLSNNTIGGVWTISNTLLATINNSGLVTGVLQGVPTIYYTFSNNIGCITRVSTILTVNKNTSLATISGYSAICVGSTTILSGSPSGGTWISNNDAVATITNAGIVSGIAAGTTQFEYTNTATTCAATSLDVTINVATSSSATVSSSGSYFWNGVNYVTSGIYVKTFTGANSKGCDSVATLYLTIKLQVTAIIAVTACETYTWHGGTYGTSGVHTFDSLNFEGFDSLTTLNLTIITPVVPAVNIAAIPSGIIVAGTPVTFTAIPTNGGSTPFYQWKKNGNNVGSGSITYTDTVLVNNDTISCIMTTSNSCQTTGFVNSNSITNTVTTVIPNYIWTGTTSIDWSVATNWTNNILPTSGVTVTIPSAPTNQPVLSTDVSINGIILIGSITINGYLFTITGSVSGSGILKGSATSSLEVNSISNNTIRLGTSATDSLLANLTNSGSGTLTLGNGVGITKLLSITGGGLNTNNHLTLKSTSIVNTAVSGPVSGTVTGNVTVERFIPQGIKAFRSLITGGVYNTGSIFKNWQENGATNNGYGIFITGKVDSLNGVDPTSGLDKSPGGNITMYNYLNYLTYIPVTNTKNTNLDPYTGYLTVVYGNRSFPLIPSAIFDASRNMHNATTIRTTGSLITGTVTYNNAGVTNTNYSSVLTKILPLKDTGSFIANPYACAIDWEGLARTNLTTTYYYYEPTYANGGYQSFVSYNAVSHSNSNPNKSKINRYIQPGQGFWIQTNSSVTTNRQLIITESNKVTNQPFTAVFGTGAAGVNRLAISLWEAGENIDGAVAVFDNNFTSAYGDEDSKKLFATGENLSIIEGNNSLSIDGIATPAVNDVIALQTTGLTVGKTYTIQIDAQEMNSNGLTAYLVDATQQTEQLLSSGTTTYSFVAGKVIDNRFSVVFKAGAALSVKFISVKANQGADKKTNIISWTISDEINIDHYEVEQSATGKDYAEIAIKNTTNNSTYTAIDIGIKTAINYYKIKAVNIDAKYAYSRVVIVSNNNKGSIAVTPNPVMGSNLTVQMNNLENGKYKFSLYSKAGQLIATKEVTMTGGSCTTIELPINNTVANGIYNLSVRGVNDYTTEVIITGR